MDNRTSITALGAALIVAFGLAAFSITITQNNGYLVWSDGVAYFLYTRSAIVDGDTDISNEFITLSARYGKNSDWLKSLRDWVKYDASSGRVESPWPAGAAIVMGPFYTLGYALELGWARLQQRAVDSYGLLPQLFFCFGSLFYVVLGWWAMARAARRLGAVDWVAYGSASAVVFAGPIAFYGFFHPSMAHAPSFGLVALLTLAWLWQWQTGSGPLRMVLLGILVGVLLTLRYQNLLFGLLPLALLFREGGYHRRSLSRLLATLGGGGIGFVLPLLLWPGPAALLAAVSAGTPAAADTGANLFQVAIGGYPLDLRAPYFFQVLLSCRHGAFFWAPLLGVGALGLIATALVGGRRGHDWALPVLLTVAAQAYLIGALGMANLPLAAAFNDWSRQWNGAPSFGMRYLAECGPLLGLGVVAVLNTGVRRFGSWFRWGGLAALAALSGWNLLLVVAYGLQTISRAECVSYGDFWRGVVDALARLGG